MIKKLKNNHLRKQGLLSLSKGKYKKALKYFIKVLTDSQLFTDKYNVGLAYMGLNQYDKAIEYFNQVQLQEPENELNLLCIAEIYLFTKKFDKAIEYFDKLTKLYPDNRKYRKYLSMAKDPEKREKHIHCKQLIDQGDEEIQKKNYESAIEKFNHALQLDKNNAHIYNYLGVIYLNYYKNVKKATDYFEKATKLAPKNKKFLYNLEKSYKKLK